MIYAENVKTYCDQNFCFTLINWAGHYGIQKFSELLAHLEQNLPVSHQWVLLYVLEYFCHHWVLLAKGQYCFHVFYINGLVYGKNSYSLVLLIAYSLIWPQGICSHYWLSKGRISSMVWQLCSAHGFSMGPSDAIWWHISGSPLAEVMACCLTAPSHSLNQCWLIINWFCENSLQGNTHEINL